MVAALSCLALNDGLFRRVVPQDQELSREYTGKYDFKRVLRRTPWGLSHECESRSGLILSTMKLMNPCVVFPRRCFSFSILESNSMR